MSDDRCPTIQRSLTLGTARLGGGITANLASPKRAFAPARGSKLPTARTGLSTLAQKNTAFAITVRLVSPGMIFASASHVLCTLLFLELETNMSNDAPHLPHGHREDRPYWKRAHHDWRFWFGLTAMLVAISFYVVTNNLSTARTGAPRNLPPAVSRVP
jgi:hypothetical protein